MKKIELTCNPVGNLLKFPAEVKYFLFHDDVGPFKIERAIDAWCDKNKMAKFRINTEYIIKDAEGLYKWEKI